MKYMKFLFKVFLVFLSLFFVYLLYLFFEPEISKSAELTVTQMVINEISLFCDSEIAGLSSISGMTGGTSNGNFSCIVVTNNDEGYTLFFNKLTPLCHSTQGCGQDQQFNDYPGTTNNPIDFNWQNAGNGEEYWGFEMRAGEDVTQRFRNNTGPSAPCNAQNGIVSPDHCWVRIPTSPNYEIVGYRNFPTDVNGSSLTFGIRIQAGPNNSLRSGTYTSTISITAAMN